MGVRQLQQILESEAAEASKWIEFRSPDGEKFLLHVEKLTAKPLESEVMQQTTGEIRRDAATQIQSRARGNKVRRYKELQKQEKAATKIQAHARGKSARQNKNENSDDG